MRTRLTLLGRQFNAVVATLVIALCLAGLAVAQPAFADDEVDLSIRVYEVDYKCDSLNQSTCGNRVPVDKGDVFSQRYPSGANPQVLREHVLTVRNETTVEEPTRDQAPCGRLGYKKTSYDSAYIRFSIHYTDVNAGQFKTDHTRDLFDGLQYNEVWRFQMMDCSYRTLVSERRYFYVAFLNGVPGPGEEAPAELPPPDGVAPHEVDPDFDPCVSFFPPDSTRDAAKSMLRELFRAKLISANNPCQLATEIVSRPSPVPVPTDFMDNGALFRCANVERYIGLTALGVDAGEAKINQYICAGKDPVGKCEVTNGTFDPGNSGDPHKPTAGSFEPPANPTVSIVRSHDLLSVNPGGVGGNGVVAARRIADGGQQNTAWQVQVQINVRVKSPVGGYDVLKTLDITETFDDFGLCD